MNRPLCHILGHRWVPLWDGPVPSSNTTTRCLVCTRCHANGWGTP